MPLLTRISRRLRRRRAQVDQVWREATRAQAEAHMAAIARILDQARALRRPAR